MDLKRFTKFWVILEVALIKKATHLIFKITEVKSILYFEENTLDLDKN